MLVNRSRWIAVTVAVAAVACADDTPAQVSSVAIAATPCDRPTARLGVGTLVAEGRVLTAAHVVEDDLRDVAVDGLPARVVALDPRIDVAILSIEEDAAEGDAATFADAEIADVVRIVTPTEVIETTVERIVTLTVDDTTDGVVRHRAALVLDGAVPSGTSGAPVVGAEGRVVGLVTISHTGRGVTYATTAAEIRSMLATEPDAGQAVTESSLAASRACA